MILKSVKLAICLYFLNFAFLNADSITKELAFKTINDFNKEKIDKTYLILSKNYLAGFGSNQIVCHIDKDPNKDFLIIYESATGIPLAFFIDNNYYFFDILSGKLFFVQKVKFRLAIGVSPKSENSELKVFVDFKSTYNKSTITANLMSAMDISLESNLLKIGERYILSQQSKTKTSAVFNNKNEVICFKQEISDGSLHGLHLYDVDDQNILNENIALIKKIIELKKSNNMLIESTIDNSDNLKRKFHLTMIIVALQRNIGGREEIIEMYLKYLRTSDMPEKLSFIDLSLKFINYSNEISGIFSQYKFDMRKIVWEYIIKFDNLNQIDK